MKRLLTSRRRLLAIGALAAVAVAVASGYGYAAVTATDNIYTGCLKPDGNLAKVAIGTSPLKACGKDDKPVTWSQTGPTGADGATGPNGATGVTGPPGPSNLDALQGSPCSFNGHPDTLQVSVDPNTAAVSMSCGPPRVEVSATAEGGTFTTVNIHDATTHTNHFFVDLSATFSVFIPKEHEALVIFESGDELSGAGATPFTFSCAGGPSQDAVLTPTVFFGSGHFYRGQCATPPLSGNFAATASFGS